jgi:hypothetical protein
VTTAENNSPPAAEHICLELTFEQAQRLLAILASGAYSAVFDLVEAIAPQIERQWNARALAKVPTTGIQPS